jgi:uncharacterized delta-60 repeat protein
MSKGFAPRSCVELIAITVLSVGAAGSLAADLTIVPDPAFGTGGYVADHLDSSGKTEDSYRNFLVDRQGRPVGLGNTSGQRFIVGRYTLAGVPDTSFAKIGKATVGLESEDVASTAPESDGDRVQFSHGGVIDGRGRIVLVGKSSGADERRASDVAILRFSDDGQLDTSFNRTGFLKLPADDRWSIGLAAAASANSASLVVAGYAIKGRGKRDPLLIRMAEDGSVDDLFTLNAQIALRTAVSDAEAAIATGVAIDGQSRYLVSLNIRKNSKASWGVARLKRDGSLDEDFGARGLWSEALDSDATNEMPFSIALDDAARIVLGGMSVDAKEYRRFAVARLSEAGKLDASFGPAGKGLVVFDNYGAKLNNLYGPRAAVWKDRIAITGAFAMPAGRSQYFGLIVLENDGKTIGKLSARPFPSSKGNDLPWGVGFDPTGRVLVGGVSVGEDGKKRFAVARYLIQR